MIEERSVAQLVEEVLEVLQRMHYAEVSIGHFRKSLDRFRLFAESHDGHHLSCDLGREYILSRYGYDIDSGSKPSSYVAEQIRAAQMLISFKETGTIPVRIRSAKKPPQVFKEQYELHFAECKFRGLSDKTIYTRERDILSLLTYLHSRGLTVLSEATPKILEEYFIAQSVKAPAGMSRVLVSVRCFMRSMFANGIIPTDLSLHIPAASRHPIKPVRKLWSPEEVERLVSSVAGTDSIGKRDYAILLLIVRYGMRSGDVLDLRLADLCWDSMTIRYCQSKTTVPNTLPILDDVGWALADWITNARPKQATSDHLFIRLTAPYCKMSCLNNVVDRHRLAAGIQSGGKNSGPHSLRHALATRMMVGEVPFPVISAVLGHSSPATTSVYLHSDIDGLRQCAMDVEVIADEY